MNTPLGSNFTDTLTIERNTTSSCYFIHSASNERGFFSPSKNTWRILAEKKVVHFPIELMYKQCATTADVKMYMKPFHSVAYISEI